MSKILNIIFFIIINCIINSELVQNEYNINIIDNDMKASNYSLSILDGKGYYYIMTGENIDNANANLFKRCLLKFDIKTNILIDKYIYNSSYPFEFSNAIFAGKDNQYLLTISKNSLEFFNFDKLTEYPNENANIIGKQKLLKIESFYYYIFLQETTENNKLEHILIIEKIEIIDDESPSYKIISKSEPLKVGLYLTTISCSTSKDKQFIICSYYSEDSYFTISVHDLNLNLIQIEKGEFLFF